MKKNKKLKKLLLIPIIFCCCIFSAKADYFSRTVYMMQQYNTLGGATKATNNDYVYLDGLDFYNVSAVTFTPVNSSGGSVGSPITVYDGFIGKIQHSLGKGSFIDLKFRNHSYTLSSGTIYGIVSWN